MSILRMGHDAWGRPVIEGISWELIWVALGLGVLVITGHLLYRLLRGAKPE